MNALVVLLLFLLWPIGAHAAVLNPFVTIAGTEAPLSSSPCPPGYPASVSACFTFPVGPYGPFTVSATGALRAPTLLAVDTAYTDILTLSGVAVSGPSQAVLVITYGATYSVGAPGTYLYSLRAAGSFETPMPAGSRPLTLERNGCFTAGAGCVMAAPILTLTPSLIGGTNFSQSGTAQETCNVAEACGETIIDTLTVNFVTANTLRLPGSLEEEVTVTAIPEPSSLWLLGGGLLFLSALLAMPYWKSVSKLPQPIATLWIAMGLVSSIAAGVLLLMWP